MPEEEVIYCPHCGQVVILVKDSVPCTESEGTYVYRNPLVKISIEELMLSGTDD